MFSLASFFAWQNKTPATENAIATMVFETMPDCTRNKVDEFCIVILCVNEWKQAPEKFVPRANSDIIMPFPLEKASVFAERRKQIIAGHPDGIESA